MTSPGSFDNASQLHEPVHIFGDRLTDRSLKRLIISVFVLAMIMGPGPGLRLVNPDAADPSATFTFLGIPTIYAWGLFWYFIQLAAIIVAYKRLWKE